MEYGLKVNKSKKVISKQVKLNEDIKIDINLVTKAIRVRWVEEKTNMGHLNSSTNSKEKIN